MLPTLHPGDTVWILDRRTMGRVVKEIAPRSFVVETQEGNFRRNRRGLVLMPKDQDERGGDMQKRRTQRYQIGNLKMKKRNMKGKNMWIQRYRIGNPKKRKRKTKATWKTQRHGMLKIHAGRGKHLGWNPKRSM